MKGNELEIGKNHAFGFLVVDVHESSAKPLVNRDKINRFFQEFVEGKVKKYGGMV